MALLIKRLNERRSTALLDVRFESFAVVLVFFFGRNTNKQSLLLKRSLYFLNQEHAQAR